MVLHEASCLDRTLHWASGSSKRRSQMGLAPILCAVIWFGDMFFQWSEKRDVQTSDELSILPAKLQSFIVIGVIDFCVSRLSS